MDDWKEGVPQELIDCYEEAVTRASDLQSQFAAAQSTVNQIVARICAVKREHGSHDAMEEVKCPKCGAVEDDYTDFVSYWGDQSLQFECSGCGEKLVAHEHVERTFTVTAREPVSFTAHEHEGEWVIRIHDGKGSYAGLGVAVGEEEADLIVRSLNSVCSYWASTSKPIRDAWCEFLFR